VTSFTIRPSHDIGRMAAHFLRRERPTLQRSLGRTLLRRIDVGEGAEAADLASYLLFDGQFASELIALGHADAAAHEDELEAFVSV
jgi:NTE family protein